MSDEQLDLLKKKLVVSVKSRQKLERTYEQQFSTLTDFILRLSNVCKGIDIELDNKLGKLRTFLSKNTDIDKLSPLINELTELLKQHETRITLNLKQAQTALLGAGKKLQKVKGLPDNLRRELRSTLKGVEVPQDSIIHLLPSLEKLVGFYQEVLVLKAELESNNTASNDSADLDTDNLQKEVAAELLNILSNIAFSGNSADKIDAIRNTLAQPVQAQTLVDSCVEIIRLVIESITEERQSAQNFLFSLNDALSSVHTAVATSISGSKEISSSKQKINDKLKEELAGMSKEVAKATSLDGLKKEINRSIGDIVSALNQKEELEAEEHQLLIDSLSEMEVRLKDLEVEAEEYKKKLSEQRFKSLQDALTKLPNRASLDERMELEYRRWMRYNHDLCLAVADIDHFKKINDSLGHSVGDRVLQIVAQSLQKTLRETDYIARYGGEEFVLIFPESNLKSIEKRLNTIRQHIESIPFKFKHSDLKVTVSMGVTQFKAIDQPQGAFDRADQALYEAKNAGRNRVVVKR